LVAVSFRKPDELDARFIATNVREADFKELVEGSLTHPYHAMIKAMADSPDQAFTATIRDMPICMFGVSDAGLVGSVGVPWMVGTHLIDRHSTSFLRQSRHLMVEMFNRYDMLINYVDARNTRAIQWLKWLGFTIEEPQPYGPKGLPFNMFRKTRESLNV